MHFPFYDYLGQISPPQTQSPWPEFWGAFAGALFAFIFGLFSYRLIKRYERFMLHKDAIVKIERALNDAIDNIGINKRAALNIGSLLRQDKLTFNRFIPFELPPNVGTDLASIALVNDFYSYERSMHRINADIKSLNYALTRFEDTRIAGQQIGQENLIFLATKIEHEFLGHLKPLDEATKTLLCSCRLYLKKLGGRNLFYYANARAQWDIPPSATEIEKERELLTQEIATISKTTSR